MSDTMHAAIGLFGCAAGMALAIWAAHLIDELVNWKKRHKH